jgi:hypothetical protein
MTAQQKISSSNENLRHRVEFMEDGSFAVAHTDNGRRRETSRYQDVFDAIQEAYVCNGRCGLRDTTVPMVHFAPRAAPGKYVARNLAAATIEIQDLRHSDDDSLEFIQVLVTTAGGARILLQNDGSGDLYLAPEPQVESHQQNALALTELGIPCVEDERADWLLRKRSEFVAMLKTAQQVFDEWLRATAT